MSESSIQPATGSVPAEFRRWPDTELSPGTFTELWAAFRQKRNTAFGGNHESV